MTEVPKMPPDRLLEALGPWITDGQAPRTGVEFARLVALAGRVPPGCAIRVDFSVTAELGAPLVILERPVPQSSPRWPAALSPREREIASWLASGASNKQIARSLALTPGTVKAYVHSILTKLGLPNRASVAAAYHGGNAPADDHHHARDSDLAESAGTSTLR